MKSASSLVPNLSIEQQSRPSKTPSTTLSQKCSKAGSQTKSFTSQQGVKLVAPLDLIKFNKDCLKAHNDYRKSHFAPSLRLNERLRKYAQEWADTLARENKIAERPENFFGENIYCCEGFEPTGFRTAQRWYEEMGQFDFGRPDFAPNTGHFTQMVWRKTQELGVGVARAANGNYFVVANYNPPGNVINHYRTNVLQRGSNLPKELWKRGLIESVRTVFRPFDPFQIECLRKHNEYRARHDTPPLRLSVPMCREAQAWAQTLAAENVMRSRGRARYGENIYSIKAVVVQGSMPVEAWYSEVDQYKGKYTPGTGHFTQIVWVASVELGVGVARSCTGEVYVVANYYPPGNIQYENEKNVRMWRK